MRIEFDPDARHETHEAARWYERQRAGLGFEFLAELRAGVAAIDEDPERWPKLTKFSRRYRLNRFPYWVVYQQRDDHLRVLAVMHQSRRPRYWKKREQK